MNNYKIKISCTSKDELCYNNKKISIKNYNKLKLEEFINKNDIYKLLILHKKINSSNFTTKTLEFLCNFDKEMSEDDFQLFIKYMIDIGFNSKHNTIIQFIDNKRNEPIYTYNFQTITKTNNKNKMPNNSTYSTQILYKK